MSYYIINLSWWAGSVALQVARIFLFIFFFIHMWIHFDEVIIAICFWIPTRYSLTRYHIIDASSSALIKPLSCLHHQVKQIFPLGFYSLLGVPPVLAMMNIFWFWKIAKGLLKTLSKAKHSKWWKLIIIIIICDAPRYTNITSIRYGYLILFVLNCNQHYYLLGRSSGLKCQDKHHMGWNLDLIEIIVDWPHLTV